MGSCRLASCFFCLFVKINKPNYVHTYTLYLTDVQDQSGSSVGMMSDEQTTVRDQRPSVKPCSAAFCCSLICSPWFYQNMHFFSIKRLWFSNCAWCQKKYSLLPPWNAKSSKMQENVENTKLQCHKGFIRKFPFRIMWLANLTLTLSSGKYFWWEFANIFECFSWSSSEDVILWV